MTLNNGCLPKTIEGATGRYLNIYENRFEGPHKEMLRLKAMAEANIYVLRRKAPNFYENHLCKMINQAASNLLTHDTKTADGSRAFHVVHRNLLRVLDELKKSQPQGEVNFQTEVDRLEEKDKLIQAQITIRNRINLLEATEIDCDEMGCDEAETQYNKIFTDLDKYKQELKKVSRIIAKLEGEDLDACAEFKLLISEGSALERLTVSEQKKLEEQISDYLIENKNKKKAMYVDKSIIDGMIAKLDLKNWQLVQLNDLAKDALDAYKQHFRNIEIEDREEFYQSLLNNKHLEPKEGLILNGPDDVPEDVRLRLEASERRSRRKFDECIEEFARKQPDNVDENLAADAVEDDDDNSNDGEFLEILEEHGHLFQRIKEEPRGDYDNDAPSDDEAIVSEDVADEIEGIRNGQSSGQNGNASPQRLSSRSASCDNGEQLQPTASNMIALQQSTNNNQNGGSREFEMLGIVEPADKIEVIEIDDD